MWQFTGALKSRRDTDTTSSYVTLDLCVEAVGDNAYAFLTPFFSGARAVSSRVESGGVLPKGLEI